MPNTNDHVQDISRLNFRLPSEVKEKIERAAVVSGLTVTDFAIHSLIASAEDVLERHQATVLSNRDRDLFLALVESDEKPNEALLDAVKDFKRLISR
jgi:uncharacterized protein (DUF1778 family)